MDSLNLFPFDLFNESIDFIFGEYALRMFLERVAVPGLLYIFVTFAFLIAHGLSSLNSSLKSESSATHLFGFIGREKWVAGSLKLGSSCSIHSFSSLFVSSSQLPSKVSSSLLVGLYFLAERLNFSDS